MLPVKGSEACSMAKLIGSVRSTNFGENLFITKAQEFLDDNYIIYWNRQIYGRDLMSVFSCQEKVFWL